METGWHDRFPSDAVPGPAAVLCRDRPEPSMAGHRVGDTVPLCKVGTSGLRHPHDSTRIRPTPITSKREHDYEFQRVLDSRQLKITECRALQRDRQLFVIHQKGTVIMYRLPLVLAVIVGAGLLTNPISLQEPYSVVDNWMKPFAESGYAWGGHSAVYAESPDRIFVGQAGEIRLPDPVPPGFAGFIGSIGLDSRQPEGGQQVWRNILFVVDGDGNMTESWTQWDELFGNSTDGAAYGGGPHRIRINQYDPERRVWVVNPSRNAVHAFTNDGSELLMTLGEEGVSGNDETHLARPSDIAFMEDGTMFVADGPDNGRIVKFDAEGNYVTHWGVPGSGRGEFNGVHSLATDIRGNIYVVDRLNNRIQVFNQTTRSTWYHPNISPIGTWPDFDNPYDIYVTGYDVWVAGATYMVKLDVNGNRLFTYDIAGDGPGQFQGLHQISIDSEGNWYGADGRLGRTQKFSPREGAPFAELMATPNPPLQ